MMDRVSSSMKVFECSPLTPGVMFDLRDDRHPSVVHGFQSAALSCEVDHTHFGFVLSGRVTLEVDAGRFELGGGMYFAASGSAKIEGPGVGYLVSQQAYEGLFQIGGPVEHKGRLRYIDGCSDTVLVAPPMQGDPCLNLLYIPPHVDQTAHTHPSVRVGMVISGSGLCRTSEGATPLQVGSVFLIRSDGLHSFHTQDDELRIVAWHPDSDCGPSHDSHPMLNRTIVDGQPANEREQRR